MASETRIANVVRFVAANPHCTLSQIARRFDAKERMARTYIQRANDSLAGAARIAYDAAGRGYVLTVNDADAYSVWSQRAADASRRALPSTSEGRAGYLLTDLLFRDDWVTLDDLASVLFVSRASVSADLKRVETELARFGLTLERRPHYGIRVCGTEISRRLCMASVVTSYERTSPDHGDAQSDMAAVEEIFSAFCSGDPSVEGSLLHEIAGCVDDATRASGFRINSAAYQNLLVHIAVAIHRIEEHCYVPLDDERLRDVSQTEAFCVAEDIADLIAAHMGVELPREEVAYMALHLAGKHQIGRDDPAAGNLVIGSEVWEVVSSMLDAVWRSFRFDFRHDLELRMNLARHIVPLSVRMRSNMELRNPMLPSIRSRYPLAWSMALDTAVILEGKYGSRLSDDEKGYIALAFALALERSAAERPKKNLLVVCASGAGTSRLLEYRCRREFGDWIGTITTSDVFHLSDVDFTDVDYVFTTVHISQALPVPICELHNFLDAPEAERLRGILRGPAGTSAGALSSRFSKDLFFPHMTFGDKDEAIDFLLDKACAAYGLGGGFRAAVHERERVVATYLGNGVAMPHPVEAACDATFGAVALLDEPLVWDEYGHSARAIFLMSFSREGGREVQDFISTLAEFVNDPAAMRQLAQDQSWDTLRALMGDQPIASNDGTPPAGGTTKH